MASRMAAKSVYLNEIYPRYHIKGYFTNCTTTGLEDLLTSGVLHSWHPERYQKVVLDGQASDPPTGLPGVPKGSVLGPVRPFLDIH